MGDDDLHSGPLVGVLGFESDGYYLQNNNGSYLGVDASKGVLTTRKKVPQKSKPHYRWKLDAIPEGKGKVTITSEHKGLWLTSDIPKKKDGKTVFLKSGNRAVRGNIEHAVVICALARSSIW